MSSNRTLHSQLLVAAGLCAALLSAACVLDGEGTDKSARRGAEMNEQDDVSETSPSADEPTDEGEDDGSAPDTAPTQPPSQPSQPGQPVPPPSNADAGLTPAPTLDGGAAVDAATPRADATTPRVDAATPREDASTPGDPGGRRCGTRGGVTCSDGQFCNFEPDVDCGGTDRGGVCETKPEVCDALYAPVCGCDNRTYSSDCVAHAAGVSVKRKGACTPAECEAAGGTVKASKGADIPRCNANEEQWALSGGIEPIICCKKREGGGKPPPSGGKMCGGFAGLSCDGEQFCNYEPAAGGDGCEYIADGAGVCQPLPMGCTKEYAPVCGCDGRTYANACVAHMAGESVKRDGLCTDVDCRNLGGRPVDGLGPPPKCAANERDLGSIRYANGKMAIEGTICCALR